MTDDPLTPFSRATRDWFGTAFGSPTEGQRAAWEAISAGEHTLVVAPTGSGKTLAAFLSALDGLIAAERPAEPRERCRVLYVSPMKALAVDVRRNLRSPLEGIGAAARRLGQLPPDIEVGVRTGDTPSAERRAFTRRPPDILVTTPESLFLLLTSAARESLRGVETVIVDEVHAVAGDKRGAHLAVSLDRLDELLERPAQRIGLSATVRPVEEVSGFLAGGRPTRVVRPPDPKRVDVSVEVPLEDMTAPEATAEDGSAPDGNRKAAIWPAVRERVLRLVREHRSTIVFTNSRRLAERLTAGLNELATERLSGAACDRDPAESGVGELSRGQRFPAEAVGGSGITAGSEVTVARAHHGSMSKHQRRLAEEELKSGALPCVVATSSLELGIDMGTVDLVVQVEAPPSVASGMQRVGRGGHHVGAPSTGVVFPKFRGDLVDCAVVAERMREGLIESLSVPRAPLDVLAQQVVAAVAMDPREVGELAALVRRSAPFAELSESALRSVLDMLSGRYPSEEFGELRPRIVWDRTTDELRARPGAQRLAVTSGGTIPDRGLFTVVAPDGESTGRSGGTRVGELDEEMVHESRVGDTFLLGTSAWRVADITHDRVVVEPAPGRPARMPFWKGDSPGRPLELGRAVGTFLRELSSAEEGDAAERARRAGLDEYARKNLLAYVAEQRAATGHVPDDRTIVIERFRDELGDWRVVVHSPFGAGVNAPWALIVEARLGEFSGVDAQVVSSDDGMVLRLTDAADESGEDVVPGAGELVADPGDVRRLVTESLSGSALFASRFRECAARALLLPRRDPRRRSPLWQQRRRAARLLEVAARYEGFPIVLETMRECMRDVYDVAGLVDLMSRIEQRRVRVVEVDTSSPSPFARTLLFGYAGMFLYEGDAPLAERRSAALTLDSALLAELLGSEALRELLVPEAVDEVESRLQRLDPRRRAGGVEDTADMLRFLGDLTEREAAERGADPAWLRELEQERRAFRACVAGETRWIAVEDAGKVRDALGVALPPWIPEDLARPVADPLAELILRHARCHGPFDASGFAERFGLGHAVAAEVLDRLATSGHLVRGELRPLEAGGGRGTEYCDPEVLRGLRRASLARLRSEISPVDPAALGRFLPAWQGVGSVGRGSVADVFAVVEQLAGVPLPSGALESLVLPARVPDYEAAMLDELTSNGEVVWVGAGSSSASEGWVVLAPVESAGLVLPERTAEHAETSVHEAVRAALRGGALFFRQLTARVGESFAERGESAPADTAVSSAVWELVWSGEVTNDTLAPLRTLMSGGARSARRSAPRGRRSGLRSGRPRAPGPAGPPSMSGRWSLAPSATEDLTRRATARTEVFLDRHGVLTRGSLEAERIVGGSSRVYTVLRGMEEAGSCRRGYLVEGLGAAQFAVPGAVDQLREFERAAPEAAHDSGGGSRQVGVVLAAADPAQPYGAALRWPDPVGETRHRPGRRAGAVVVLVSGEPVFYVERGGRSLLSFTEDEGVLRAAAERLADSVRAGGTGQLSFRTADGAGAVGTRLAGILTEFGFRPTPQGLRLRG
ncbi:ATP-dependent helicase [Actinopolyspora halophila]|uniref:ATP-dependent helicase n=1 Tax=Actinopolyspora halophila TaxID=1850 RepID=UPI00036B6578|nr:ATP-dependent helicase [Actinopolyspora halophila]